MKNWKIGTRLGTGFALVLALAAVIAAIGVMGLQRVGDGTQRMAQQSLAKERLAAAWMHATSNNSVRTFALVKSNDPAVQAYLQQNIGATSKLISETQKKLEALLASPEEEVLSADIRAKRSEYIALRNSILKLKADGKQDEAGQVTDSKLVPMLASYDASIQAMLAHQQSEIDRAAAGIDALYRSGRVGLISLTVAALALGAALAWWLTRGITRPLGRALDVARSVAAGDLTQTTKVDSRDEVGQLLQALNEMNHNLAKIVGEVRQGTDTIATASSQIASGNQDLSSRTEEQASSLEQTAASMEELTSTVKQNADNARQ
ncbi:MCP four helix bundle domain-containing protein, partial [Variovorax sp. ZT4R33]|uniref:MCP four helix bundle domain-containing protein n=1 Tax=Variovorax sp. ZT4R33 TaxID=3443743 RepID=UPI003F472FE3